MDIKDLSDRNRVIFRQIVETYLETGEPVGSRTLSRVDGIDVSPATIRNVMADLEEGGLISAPHVSAGRIPTDMGLRLFVDGLMQVGELTSDERAIIRGRLKGDSRSVEDVLGEAAGALSGLAQCASLVMVPKSDLPVRHIEFVPLAPGRALVVLVSEDGSVENRLIQLPPGLPPATLVQAGNYLSARLRGRTLTEAQIDIEKELTARESDLDALGQSLVEKGLAVWTRGPDENASLIVAGTGHLLDGASTNQKDFARLKTLFDEIERKKDLVRMLDMARSGSGVRMFIGSENNLFSLSGSSLVVAPYMGDGRRVVGVVGVIGPTRLNYARIIPMVDYTAQVMTRLLGQGTETRDL